jgi:hypothetical protein
MAAHYVTLGAIVFTNKEAPACMSQGPLRQRKSGAQTNIPTVYCYRELVTLDAMDIVTSKLTCQENPDEMRNDEVIK